MRVQKMPAAPDSAAGDFYIRKNNKKADTKECRLYILVEATGFEPTTSWSRSRLKGGKTGKKHSKTGVFGGFSFRYPDTSRAALSPK